MPLQSNRFKQELLDRGANTALNSDTLYFELVTATPTPANGTRADLTPVSGGNYAPVLMGGRTLTDQGVGEFLTCNNPQWLGLYAGAATPIVGYCVLRRVGASPAGTDPWLFFNEFIVNTTVAACSTTNGSVTITSTNSFPSNINDMMISGTNIPVNAQVLERVDANTLRMNKRATGSATGTVTATITTLSPYTPATALPGADFSIIVPTNGLISTNVL